MSCVRCQVSGVTCQVTHVTFFCKLYFDLNERRKKLDGVGPVDNRPSTDWLHHIVQFVLSIFKAILLMVMLHYIEEYSLR